MGRKKTLKSDDLEQYARFVETAEQLKDEGAEEEIEEAMKKIIKAKGPKRKSSDSD